MHKKHMPHDSAPSLGHTRICSFHTPTPLIYPPSLKMLPASIARSLERTDLSELELAGVGCFAQVFKAADTGLVIKQTFDHPVVGNLQQSVKRIYKRIGSHPYILHYSGESCGSEDLPSGLVLEYHPAGTLADNLDLSQYTKQRGQ